jgi:tetratricopeptide (TPR) repeat protein
MVLYNTGQYSAALPDFTKAISMQPDQGVNYRQRADSYYALDEFPAALADYTSALQREPNNAIYYQLRGLLYHTISDFSAALADLNHALILQPENTLHYYWRSLILLSIGRYPDALADMQRSEVLDSGDALTQSYCAFWCGVIHQLLGQPEASHRELARAANVIPNIKELHQQWRSRAVLELFQGQVEQARECYTQVLNNNRKRHSLFSPRLYLRQLARLFPERKDIREMSAWFESRLA